MWMRASYFSDIFSPLILESKLIINKQSIIKWRILIATLAVIKVNFIFKISKRQKNVASNEIMWNIIRKLVFRIKNVESKLVVSTSHIYSKRKEINKSTLKMSDYITLNSSFTLRSVHIKNI